MSQQVQVPADHGDVLARYRELRQQHQAAYDGLQAKQRRAVLTLVAVVMVIAFQTSISLHGRHAAWPMLVSFAIVVALIVFLVRLQEPVSRAERLIKLYVSNLARADGSEPDTELTGEGALPTDPQHLFARDLDITGPHSLFSMLGTVRTGIGERGLARYLLLPATHQQALERQEAVRELLPQTSLRERIALLGASSFQQLSASYLDSWLEEAAPAIHPGFRYALLATTAAVVALVVAGIFKVSAWHDVLQNLGLVLCVQAALALLIRKRIKPLLEGSARLQGQVRLFSEGLALLERERFSSVRLHHLQAVAREPLGAVSLLKKLDGNLVILEQRTREYFFVLSLLTAAGSQAAMAIAGWKRSHAGEMRRWLEALGEFEALNALATYAYEHPADGERYAWPELLPADAPPTYEARALGHPLLASGVRNDIGFDPEHRFLLISGSNMAGKSTLMRSVGTNAVLAYAGVPVRAAALRLTPLTLGASIALTDSLSEGKSKFLAEVERLAAIVKVSKGKPVLFLVDEIFSGTNSADRRTAAAAVLERLLEHGAIGALSTHDLALTSLATPENGGTNVHMASPDAADPLAFDYLLKPGINQASNALAIIQLIGLE